MAEWNAQVDSARKEFATSMEADNMLRGLHQAAAYCTGPNSSRQHGERIRAVEQARDELRAQGK